MCVTSASGGNFDATSNPQRATWLIQDDCSFWPEHNHQISVYSANSMRESCSFKDCLPGLTETWTSRNVIYIRLWLWLNLYLVTIYTFHHLNKGRSDVRLHVSKPALNWRVFFFSQRNNTSVNNPPSHQPTHSAVCVYACVISFSWMLHVALTFSPPALWRDAAPLTRCKKWLTVISLFRLIQYSIS